MYSWYVSGMGKITKDTRCRCIRLFLQARVEKQLSQAQLAAKAHISQPELSRFERCKSNPTLGFLYNLADALEMELNFELEPLSEFDDLIKEILRNENSR